MGGARRGLEGPGGWESRRTFQPLSLREPETPATSLLEGPHLQATPSHHFTCRLRRLILHQWPKPITFMGSMGAYSP